MTPDLKFYLSIFLRRLHYFLLVAVAVAAIGVTIAMILPAKYRAEALMLVEGAQIPGDLASSTVRTGVPEQIEIIKQRLLSRATLLEIAERFRIYSGEGEANPTQIVNDMRARIGIVSNVGKQTGVYSVHVYFDGDTADQAAQVTNELVTLILQENIEMRTGAAVQTLEFFQQEAERLGGELDRLEAELLAFQTEHQDSLPDSLNYRRTRQTALQERLLQLQREEGALKDRRARLVDLYQRTGTVELGNAQLSPEQQRLRDLRAELENALLVYSPQNPRIRTLQAQVEAMEKSVAGTVVEENNADAVAEPSLYELQLAQIDGDLTYNAEQKAQVETELEALRVSIEQTPANAALLSELERTYKITQDQYANAVNRLSQARTGERIEVMSKGQRITLIEQPVLPTDPYSPNRKMIAAAGLGGGIFLGFALVLLLELLNRSIRRPAEIEAALDITPIATLPYVRTRREVVLRRGIIAAAFAVAVFGISGGLYALDRYYLPMDLLVEKVIDKTGLGPVFGQIGRGVSG